MPPGKHTLSQTRSQAPVCRSGILNQGCPFPSLSLVYLSCCKFLLRQGFVLEDWFSFAAFSMRRLRMLSSIQATSEAFQNTGSILQEHFDLQTSR